MRTTIKTLCGVIILILVDSISLGQVAFEKPPIDYARAESHDAVAQLARAVEDGSKMLEYSQRHGWLPSVLEQLDISVDSQLLVFSKTSLQLHKISPRTPRAIYFNDDVYVGWCQRGDMIEIAATDPQLGSVFYTLDQTDSETPVIRRDRGQCLTCHANYRTQSVPGLLVRSIFSDRNGRPRTGTRTYVTDHTSDFEKRYGGWYVSGTHGDMRHMGNVISRDRLSPETIDRDKGANLTTLGELVDTSPYLKDQSDLVALMVLEHQSQMHNLISRANIESRIAAHYDHGVNRSLDRPRGTVSPSTKRRIESAGEELVRYMLFADELELTSPIVGNKAFIEQFQDSKYTRPEYCSMGRSLRQFDLKTRMFKYPCSYLIHSDSFAALPETMTHFVGKRVNEILSAETSLEGYERLSNSDRQAIREILNETKPGFLR